MVIEIKNRWNGDVIFSHECENNTISMTVKKALNSYANLSGANLSDVDLSGADLSRADLSDANLSDANLSAIKNDLWSVLLQQKEEVLGLKNTLKLGNIDGSVYDGDCCCLIGTIGKVANCNYKNLKVQPNPNRPIERWFLAIKKGDNPENSQVAKITLEWIEEFETLIK